MIPKFLLIFLVFALAQGQQCEQWPMQVPPFVNKSDKYPFAEAGLQIFTKIKIPCEGVITAWHFYPLMNYVLQLHLAVFRQHWYNGQQYMHVGDNYIDIYKVSAHGPVGPTGWVTYPAQPQIPVMPGDVIGMYYDNLATVQPLLSITSKKLFGVERDLAHPTFIFLMDSPGLRSKNYIIDTSAASIEYRIPALAAIVDSVESPSPTITAAEVTTTEPEYPLPEEEDETTTTPRPYRRTTSTTTTEITPPPLYPTDDDIMTTEVTTETRRPSRTTRVPVVIVVTTSSISRPETTPAMKYDSRCLASPTSSLFCNQRQIRAFFDYTNRICREYYGCPGVTNDGNNFVSSAECRRICTPQPLPQPMDAVCRQTPTALEVCYQKSMRYFYNPYKQGCMSFYGCSLGGVKGNNFDTLEECNRCKGQILLMPRLPNIHSPNQAPSYSSLIYSMMSQQTGVQ